VITIQIGFAAKNKSAFHNNQTTTIIDLILAIIGIIASHKVHNTATIQVTARVTFIIVADNSGFSVIQVLTFHKISINI
jgi:hypothetical protein